MDVSPADRWATVHRQTTIPTQFIPFHLHLRAYTGESLIHPSSYKSPWPQGIQNQNLLAVRCHCNTVPSVQISHNSSLTKMKPHLKLPFDSCPRSDEPSKRSNQVPRHRGGLQLKWYIQPFNIILQTFFRLQQAATLSRNNVHRLFLQMLRSGTSHRWPFLEKKRCSRSRNRWWMFNGPYSQY